MTARILPFATRVRHQLARKRRIERVPDLTATTDGLGLTITAHEPITEERDSTEPDDDFRSNFRD